MFDTPKNSLTGMLNQLINPKINGKVQASVYKYGVDAFVNRDSLNSNFKASAIG
jgi:hypothetical protein